MLGVAHKIRDLIDLRGDGRGFEQRFDVGDGEVRDADPRAQPAVWISSIARHPSALPAL